MRLIVGAFPPETALLEDLNGAEFRISSTGIGPVEALIGLEGLVVEFGPQEIIFLGSAGLYSGSQREGRQETQIAGDFVWSHTFTLLDPGSLQGRSRMIPAMRQFAAPRPGELAKRLIASREFGECLVNTTVALSLENHTLDEQVLRQHIPGLEEFDLRAETDGVDETAAGRGRPVLENLEAYSLARFCEIHKIEFSAFLAITNRVGPEGSEEWKQNYRAMAETLQEKVRPVLENWRG